jgi:hypothetical protein
VNPFPLRLHGHHGVGDGFRVDDAVGRRARGARQQIVALVAIGNRDAEGRQDGWSDVHVRHQIVAPRGCHPRGSNRHRHSQRLVVSGAAVQRAAVFTELLAVVRTEHDEAGFRMKQVDHRRERAVHPRHFPVVAVAL